jgi:hypothetical protein
VRPASGWHGPSPFLFAGVVAEVEDEDAFVIHGARKRTTPLEEERDARDWRTRPRARSHIAGCLPAVGKSRRARGHSAALACRRSSGRTTLIAGASVDSLRTVSAMGFRGRSFGYRHGAQKLFMPPFPWLRREIFPDVDCTRRVNAPNLPTKGQMKIPHLLHSVLRRTQE